MRHDSPQPTNATVGKRLNAPGTASLPPRHLACAKILLRPRRHGNVPINNRGVCERQRQGSRTPDFLALIIVLRAVARADEPVRSPHPGHDATQVSAHRIEPKVLDLPSLSCDDVSGFALETLHQLTLFRPVSLQPIRELDWVAVDVPGDYRATAPRRDLM